MTDPKTELYSIDLNKGWAEPFTEGELTAIRLCRAASQRNQVIGVDTLLVARMAARLDAYQQALRRYFPGPGNSVPRDPGKHNS